MRIAVLGPLEVRADDATPVPVRGAKERMLLALLAADAPAAVPDDRIVELLWDGDPPPTATKTLQGHVVRLRDALEPHRTRGSPGRFVVRRGPGYSLDGADLDARTFGELAARGREALAAGDAATAAELLTEALALWRGTPYADFPDAAFAEAERSRLARVRDAACTDLLEARLAQGEAASLVPELERLVREQPLREDWWRLLAVALYRAGRQADALAALRRARATLAEELGADPGPALRAVEAAVLAHDPAVAAPPTGTCPYMGLRAYGADDVALFAGRERLVATLVARLVDVPLLAVSGPSGAGKSSVVRAGLVPALAAGALTGSALWRPVVVQPGRDPADALASVERPALLVCDQFEELWAPEVTLAAQTAFLDALLRLIGDGTVARCVVVVRGDSVGRLAEHPPVVERLDGALVLVPPLTDPELRAVVRDPAAAVGLEVEDELVDAVVADRLGRPGALPLLSTALVGTWERRRGTVLTLAGYVAAGGVAGALARSAEAAYAYLDDDGRELARQLFVRLADVDDSGALVRRPLPTADLGPRRVVAEAFLARRLLSVDADCLEVTHEALLTAWPRLGRWLEDDAAGRAVRRHLAPAARSWDDAGRPDDDLYRGARLVAALDHAGDAELTQVERDFLDAARARADRELTGARERADREARGRRRTRRLAVALAAALVVALVAGGLTLRAQRDAARASLVADANRLAALSTTVGSLDLSLLLAAQAVRLADTPETEDGLLTALIDHRRAERVVSFPGQPAGAALAAGRTLFIGSNDIEAWRVGTSAPPRPVVDLDSRFVGWKSLSASPVDDVLVASGHGEGTPWVRLFTADGEERDPFAGRPVGGVPVGVAFTPDGGTLRMVLAAGEESDFEGPARWSVVDVDPGTGARRDTGIGGTSPVPAVDLIATLSADTGAAVLWNPDGTSPPLLVDLRGGTQTPLQAPAGQAGTTAVQPLATGAVQLAEDGTVTRYDRTGAVVQQLERHGDAVRDVAVAPDGSWAVTAGDGGAVELWDVDQATGRWLPRGPLAGHTADVIAAEIDPAGQRLLTVGADSTVVVWDVGDGAGFGETYPGVPERWIANRPQPADRGRLLVAPTRTGDPTGRSGDRGLDSLGVAATFLDPATGDVVGQVPLGDTAVGVLSGSSVAVSPDGDLVAATSGFATTVLDARTRDVVERIVLPPTGEVLNGEPLPATVVWSAAWTPDGSRLLLGAEGRMADGTGGRLVEIDTETWRETGRVDIGGSAQVMEVSPDGELLAVALASVPVVQVLDARSLAVLETLAMPDGELQLDLSFSGNGRTLAVGGVDGRLHAYDTKTWRPLWESAPAQQGAVLQVEWMPDDRTVVTTGEEGTVALVDVERGLVRARPLPGSSEPGLGRAYVVPPTGDELVVLGGPHPGRRYDMATADWLDRACAVVGRDLTREEWDRYLPGREYRRTCP